MKFLFIGKRFYTNRDALREKFGRIWQLPWHWAEAGTPTRLWLVDYHTSRAETQRDGRLEVVSTPLRNISPFQQYLAEVRNDTKPDVIVASGDCYIGLMAYLLAKRLGARFVFDIYDKYDEFGGYLRFAGFDPLTFLLHRSDALLFASRVLLEQLSHKLCTGILVPNGIDTQHFRPRDMLACRATLGLPQDAIYVGYFGSLDRDRGIDDLLAAQHQLHSRGSDIKLLIAGRSRAGLSLDRAGVRYLGNLPHWDVPSALACCDILALPYRRSAYLDTASSCKIAEYMAVERPIVATRTPNIVGNFPSQAAQLGSLMALPGDPADLARAIQNQCVAKKVVAVPSEMSWAGIAYEALSSLRASFVS